MCGISARQCGVSDFAADTGGKKKKNGAKNDGQNTGLEQGRRRNGTKFFFTESRDCVYPCYNQNKTLYYLQYFTDKHTRGLVVFLALVWHYFPIDNAWN